MGLLSSCGEDRWGILCPDCHQDMDLRGDAGKLSFYEDIPAEEKLDFSRNQLSFYFSRILQRPEKRVCVFSCRLPVFTTSQKPAPILAFGFEAALVCTEGGTKCAERVLYTQPNSPAEEAGLKRGDWIIARQPGVSTSDYSILYHPDRQKRTVLH